MNARDLRGASRWLGALPLLLLVFWLGARMLDADALWYDEYYAISNAGGELDYPLSPFEIWERVAAQDPFLPPVYFMLLAGWASLVGWSAAALRVLSLLAGVLAVAWTYRLGRAMFSARVGLYAAAALGCSALFVDYLHEIRAYSLYALASAFAVWAYWRVISMKQPPALVRYGALVIGIAGLAYTHYVALAVAAVIMVYHVLFVPKNRRWWLVWLALVGGGMVFLPWLRVMFTALDLGGQDTNRHLIAMPNGAVIETLFYAFSSGSAALLFFVAFYALRLDRPPARFVWLWVVGALGLILLVNARLAFLIHIRYTLVLWPALALVVGYGAARLGRAGLNPRWLVTVWLAAGVWQSLQADFTVKLWGGVYRTPWAGLSAGFAVLAARAQPDDLALLHVNQIGFEELNAFALRYLMRDLPVRFDQFERMNNSLFYDDARYRADVETGLAGAPFVWTMVVPGLPATGRSAVVQRALDSAYAPCETLLDRPDMTMTLYARQPQRAPEAVFSVNLGDGGADPRGQIGAFLLQPPPEHAAETIEILLGWQVGGAIFPDVYSAGVHIDSAEGQLVGQHDYALPRAPFGCQMSRIGLEKLPPGQYTVHVLVYEWQTNGRLPGVSGSQSGNRLLIHRFVKG